MVSIPRRRETLECLLWVFDTALGLVSWPLLRESIVHRGWIYHLLMPNYILDIVARIFCYDVERGSGR